MTSKELASIYSRAEARWFRGGGMRDRLADGDRAMWRERFCARAVSLLVRWNDMGEAGFSCGEVDHHGELELRLNVNGHEGSVWLSKEIWQAVTERAGWTVPADLCREATP